MDPNVQRVLDELAGINSRFDEQAEGLNRRFDDLKRSLSARDVVVDTRIADLSRRICDLEAAPVDPHVQAVEGCLALLEASFTDHDADFDARIVELESLRTAHIKDERDARVEVLEDETRKLCEWRPGFDGVLDDILVSVRKLEKASAHQAFDELPPGVVLQPSKAAARPSAGVTADPPVVGQFTGELLASMPIYRPENSEESV